MSALSDLPDLQGQLSHLRTTLRAQVIGQDDAIDTIISTLERYHSGLHEPLHPIGTFLFLGPTGVGKTHLVETLAELTQPREAFIRIDCSEYSLEHEVAKLLGAPPGYQGAEIGSYLINKIKAVKEPERGFILLLDEIEKAHPKFFDLWLQVFDSGRFTDGKGYTADFSRCLIFMTSNVGAGAHKKTPDIGFRPGKAAEIDPVTAITAAVKTTFRPEFLNRLTAQVHFKPLTEEQQTRIFVKLQRDLNERFRRHEIKVLVGPRLHERLFKQGFSREYGARELKRCLITHLEQPLARKLIAGELQCDSLVLADHDESGSLVVSRIGAYPVLMEEEVNS